MRARLTLCTRSCQFCGAEFRVNTTYPSQKFCSRSCAQRSRGTGRSYPKIGNRHAHRVVAEWKLGRALRPGEIVHHQDEDRSNYASDNLEVLQSQAEHAREHWFASGRHNLPHLRKPGRVIEAFGKRQNISAWAAETGIEVSTLSYRLRRGWPPEQALTKTPHTGNRV